MTIDNILNSSTMTELENKIDIFFNQDLSHSDYIVFQSIENEFSRQKGQIELIASENFVSKAVLQAQGSVMTNKYAEGYPCKRYYGGCEYVDVVEQLAIKRLKELFGCGFANVQPHSGSQANQAVFLALLKPHDTIMGMSLNSGGHLTHGSKVTLSGKWFNAVSYDVNPETLVLDMDQVEKMAQEHKPKLIIAGGSAYPRIIDFKRFREIADSVGAYLMVDMAHFAGLVAGGSYSSPLQYADVVTSTTHKTLRGPRGGIILTNKEELAKKIDSAVFPGIQGGPLMHVIAAKAVAFGEALQPAYQDYIKQVITNTKSMGKAIQEGGINLVSGGTDSHLILVDLRSKGVNGKDAQHYLEQVNITCNKNSIPFDPTPASITSGIRLGAAACTTRGFDENDFYKVGQMIAQTVQHIADGSIEQHIHTLKAQSLDLLAKFPFYSSDVV